MKKDALYIVVIQLQSKSMFDYFAFGNL